MQLLNDFRMLDQHFRDERASLQVTAALELKYIPLGANHRSLGEACHQAGLFCACGAGRLQAFTCTTFAGGRPDCNMHG